MRENVRKNLNITKKTSFELWYGYAPNVKYFKDFVRKCYILKDVRKGKFDANSDKGIFLGYSSKRKALKNLIYKTKKIVESENVRVDEFSLKKEKESKK